MNTSKPAAKPSLRANDAKWTPLVMQAGYVVVPALILDRQSALGLDATEFNILVHLIRHWWYPDRRPYPGKKSIAECMEISESTVRRRIADMEKGKIVKRLYRRSKARGQETNEYDLSGLVDLLKSFAEEEIRRRQERDKEKAAMRRRKRPLNEKSQ
jgi:hypothetical protein